MCSLDSFSNICVRIQPLKVLFTVKLFRKNQKRHPKTRLGALWSNPRFPRFRITLEHFAKATSECSTSYICVRIQPLKCPLSREIFRKHQKRHLKLRLAALWSNPRFPRFRITLEHFAEATNKCSTSYFPVSELL